MQGDTANYWTREGIAALKAENEKLRTQNTSLQAEKSALQAEKSALQAEKSALQAEKSALQEKCNQDTARLRNEVDVLHTLLTQLALLHGSQDTQASSESETDSAPEDDDEGDEEETNPNGGPQAQGSGEASSSGLQLQPPPLSSSLSHPRMATPDSEEDWDSEDEMDQSTEETAEPGNAVPAAATIRVYQCVLCEKNFRCDDETRRLSHVGRHANIRCRCVVEGCPKQLYFESLSPHLRKHQKTFSTLNRAEKQRWEEGRRRWKNVTLGYNGIYFPNPAVEVAFTGRKLCKMCGKVLARTTSSKDHVVQVHMKQRFPCPVRGCPYIGLDIKGHLQRKHKMGIVNLNDEEKKRYEAALKDKNERIARVYHNYF